MSFEKPVAGPAVADFNTQGLGAFGAIAFVSRASAVAIHPAVSRAAFPLYRQPGTIGRGVIGCLD